MSTKAGQSKGSSSTRLICKLCNQPIHFGAEYKHESEAGVHRRCMKSDAHQCAINSRAHEIWLDAYSALCRALPKPLTEIIELFKRYWIPGSVTMFDYIKCLDQALKLVEKSSLTDDEKSTLAKTVSGLRDKIRRLASADAN